MKPIKIFGKEIIDPRAIDQLENCILEDSIGVLTADAHVGYGHPIGGAIAYRNHISLSGVGYDIGCGNKAVKTGLKAERTGKFRNQVSAWMDEIFKRISFGVGRPNNERVDHVALDRIELSELSITRNLFQLAKSQLGTVGSGNHFVDLFVGEDDYVWIGVHFGSRGFGHKITKHFIEASGIKEGGMDSKPILFPILSEIGIDYNYAMQLAGDYAYAGRDVVVNKVLEILGNPIVTFEVHNHHNFAWHEEHFGERMWVVRKGCTPAFPNQYGFVGANMFDDSVIVKGIDSEESKEGLYSTVHGAGRVLSRTQAVGKKKWIKGEDGKKRPTIVSKGIVDFDQVKQDMYMYGVELRGAGADEAPQCYKSLSEVLKYQNNTIEVVEKLTPLGVAMAGGEIYDPYKD